MSGLYIHLFGKLDIHRDDRVIDDIPSHKAQELFCYLLLHHDRPQAREALATLLWEDVCPAQARKYLRKALWQLQHALEVQIDPETSPMVQAEPDWVVLNLTPSLWLDVAVFEQVCSQVQGLPGEQLDAHAVNDVQEALSLYRGDLLTGWFHEWCLPERERLQHMYLDLLDKLMAYCEKQHMYESGIAYGQQILQYDPASERTHRRMMRLYYQAGDRTAALHQYEHCTAALLNDLGVLPQQRTVALYERICQDAIDLKKALLPDASPRIPSNLSGSLQDMLQRLKLIQRTLIDFQRQVHQDIQIIEAIVREQAHDDRLAEPVKQDEAGPAAHVIHSRN